MSEIRIHFRHLMLYESRKGSSVTIATNNICAVYGENALSSRTCRKWFQRFMGISVEKTRNAPGVLLRQTKIKFGILLKNHEV